MSIEAFAAPTAAAPTAAAPTAAAPTAEEAAEALARLGPALVESGAIDHRTLERARRVGAETGGRLDRVLTQLGLISERGLAEALAQLVAAPLVGPADYPEEPLFVDRLRPKFLRKAHALPIADGERGAARDGRSARRVYTQGGGLRPWPAGRDCGRRADRARRRA